MFSPYALCQAIVQSVRLTLLIKMKNQQLKAPMSTKQVCEYISDY